MDATINTAVFFYNKRKKWLHDNIWIKIEESNQIKLKLLFTNENTCDVLIYAKK